MKKISILAVAFLLTFSSACFLGCNKKGNESVNGKESVQTQQSESVKEEKQESETTESVQPEHTHTIVHFEAKEATCEEEGQIEYWACESCEKYFSDAEGVNEITDKGSVTVAAVGHPTETVYDEEGHWGKAICEHTDYATEKVAHAVENGVCTECGYVAETVGLEYKLTSDGAGYSVVGSGTATGENIVIPSMHENLPVTEIGAKAFKDCETVVNIKLPQSLTTIGDEAFYNCKAMTEITIPANVKKIGEGIFANCNALEKIMVDEENTTFHAEKNCLIKSAADAIIAGCKNSSIPTGTLYIMAKAFYGLSELKSVSFPSSIKTIYEFAFSGCGITTANLSKTKIKSIHYNTFEQCKKLSSVTLSSSTTTINMFAFAWCESLTSIVIPASVTTIASYAFSSCTALTSVEFKNTAGWKVGNVSVNVSDSAKNVTYLTETYHDKTWSRS